MSHALSRIDRIAAALSTRTPNKVDDPNRKLAAIAVILVPDPDAVLLIKRAERIGDTWSGQMAFPGGRWAREDADLLVTAHRETIEETGVDLSSATLLGRLDDSAPKSVALPPIIVTPFVFRLEARQPISPNHEVAAAEWTPLSELVGEGIYRPYRFDRAGESMLFPGYHLPIGTVWGMTERILTPLLELSED